MSHEKPFFMRDPWIFDPMQQHPQRTDSSLGFDTRALHAGFHPLQDLVEVVGFDLDKLPVGDIGKIVPPVPTPDTSTSISPSVASISDCTVPSPPSAIGRIRTSAPGDPVKKPFLKATAASRADSESLNESMAISTFISLNQM